MSTIFFAYELGSGLGHLNRLVAVARRLSGTHRLVFSVPNLALAGPVLARAFGDSVDVTQGVAWPAPGGQARDAPTHTFADVLTLFGFGERPYLAGKVDAWRAILQEVRPDLIVADFAPALRLAVNGAIPVVVVGNGYTVPPPGRALPPMRPWQQASPAASLDAERRILAAVNAVRASHAGEAVAHLADLFSGDATFVCTIAEFDPYRAYRTAAPTWPFNIPAVSVGPPASERRGPAIFAYLPASHPAFSLMVSALNSLPYEARIYASEADPRAIAAQCRRHVGVLTKPADFAQVLPQSRLVIHHAGLGTAYASLAAGTPQCLIPLNLEHLITARGLVGAGVAEGFSTKETAGVDLKAVLTRLLDNPVLLERARRLGAQVESRRDPDPLGSIVAACERLLDAGRAANQS